MWTKQEIRAHLDHSLVELFDVSSENIRTEARLYEDLDIDSLDAVDLVLRLREITGLKVAPEQFRKVRTVGDVVDTIHALAADSG